MPTQFFLILLFVFGFWLWTANRKAAELAQRLARKSCQQQGVQWLDDSVVLNKVRLKRAAVGLAFVWEFRFEYSTTGANRKPSKLAISENRLLWVLEPERDDSSQGLEQH